LQGYKSGDFTVVYPVARALPVLVLAFVDWGRGEPYVRGVYTMKINVPNMPVPASDQGKYIEIWKKQADGTWKIVRDIYNSDVSAAGS
jgi:hypothetical protein